MKQTPFEDRCPIFRLELARDECHFNSAQEILNHLKERVDEHKMARYIAEFDHFSHTKGLLEGEVNEEMLDARHIIFCFGNTLNDIDALAVRPRSIGIAEMRDRFQLTFLEAPQAMGSETMEQWIKALAKVA
jgi:hypothetical protein